MDITMVVVPFEPTTEGLAQFMANRVLQEVVKENGNASWISVDLILSETDNILSYATSEWNRNARAIAGH
jgi:hypothetical protein